MADVCDVVIVGGGIIGLSAAYALTQAGKNCILIEKGDIGDGASSSCDDMIMLQSKKGGILLEMALESNRMYRTLSEELGVEIEYENRGGMILIEDEIQLEIMKQFVDTQKSKGLEVEIVGEDFIKQRLPYVSDQIKVATFCPQDAQVNPFRVMEGYLNAAVKKGLLVKKNQEIRSAVFSNDRWELKCSTDTQILAENVVIAAGAWSREVGAVFGVEIPIKPKKGQIIVTEQIPKFCETNVWGASYIVSKLYPDAIKGQDPIAEEYGIGFSLTQTTDGNYMIGSTREFAGFDKSTEYKIVELLLKQAVRFFPILENVNVLRTFAGFRPATPDGRPIIGPVEGQRGLYVAAGHEGDGIALAPITGRLIEEVVNGKTLTFDIHDLSLSRFN